MLKAYLLSSDKRKEGIVKAAWQLEDAILDRRVSAYPSNLKARELHCEAAQADLEYGRALLLMVVLTILESPSWCDNSELFEYLDSDARCTVPGVKQEEVLLSNLPYIPPGWGIVIELVLIFIMARKMLLERKLQIWYFSPLKVVYNETRVIHFGLAMVLLELVDCVVFVIFRPSVRLAFIARTGYLFLLPAVRRLSLCIWAVIGEFLSIAAFYIGTIVFFAWIAVTIFDDVEGEVNGEKVNKGLDSFKNTLNTMFVAGSTDDFVSCFLPSYTTYRQSGLLWLIFLVIVQVLLLNLVLDTLVAAYTRYSEDTEEEVTKDKVKGILEAFETLTDATGEGQEVCKATFLEFASEFSKSPLTRPITEKTADIVFAAVDEDHSGKIDKREFCDVCGVIEYDFWVTKTFSPMQEAYPLIWNSARFQWFKEQVIAGNFDMFMSCVLVVNLLLVIWESVYDRYGWQETFFMENLELAFSMIYVLEVGLNLCVFSWGEYWSLRSNQFDFTTTWLLLASSVLDEVASSNAGTNVKRYMNILRLLRLLRVLKQIKRIPAVQFMVATILNLVHSSKDILTLLGVVTFFFSTLSVQLWGGLLFASNPALEETEYKEKNLFVLNFNDFSMSFGVWVVMLLCEYVPDFPDAINKVSSIPGIWVVFLIFYILGVSIVFELVKAFTIEVFLGLHKNWGKQTAETETLSEISEEMQNRGLSLHYRVVGSLSAHEKVKKALKEMDEELEEEEKIEQARQDSVADGHALKLHDGQQGNDH